MIGPMALCPSCGAERAPGGGPCVRCGGGAARPKAAMAKKQPEPEISLELAIDPRTLIQPVDPEPSWSIPAPSGIRAGAATTSTPPIRSSRPVAQPASRSLAPRAPERIEPAVHDL